MRGFQFSLFTLLAAFVAGCGISEDIDEEIQPIELPALTVLAVEDFQITGTGAAPQWENTEWQVLERREGDPLPYGARFKVVYSDTGLYVLMVGSDEVLTSTLTEDFDHLWEEDCYEVFLWTDESYPVYFEYEISPMNKELPILVPNFNNKIQGWRPWDYEGSRRTRHMTSVIGDRHESGAEITGWTAEFFIPYELLRPLQNVPPKKGTEWRANFYRVDHDHGQRTAWFWASVDKRFHEYERFGRLIFD